MHPVAAPAKEAPGRLDTAAAPSDSARAHPPILPTEERISLTGLDPLGIESTRRVAMKRAAQRPHGVFTIGHSTRPVDDFIALLRAHQIERVIDVRTIPRSRRNPQFNRETLPAALRRVRIGYRHLPALGGLRHSRRESQNAGWRNASFRGYADYMSEPEFAAAIDRLIPLAAEKRSAVMCAEAVPWRCHRSLIADALVVRGVPVEHILSAKRAERHQLTSFAKVIGKRITYPGPPPLPGLESDASERRAGENSER